MKKLLLMLAVLAVCFSSAYSQVDYVSTGTGGNYILSFPANFGFGISPGISVTFRANHQNPGAATLSINGLMADTIKTGVSTNLVANDIKLGQVVTVVYDGINFQMTSASGNSTGIGGGDFKSDGSVSMVGDFNAGGNNIYSVAFLDMNNESAIKLGHVSTTDETTFTGAFGSTDKGKTWFNTDLNKIAYWTGIGIHYVDNSAMLDADGDTYIDVDLGNADDDKIHFVNANIEYFTMNGPHLDIENSGGSVFIGKDAGLNDGLAMNSNNVFIGEESGKLNTSGSGNVALGFSSLTSNTSTSNNTALGTYALELNSAGFDNTSVGQNTLSLNTFGASNVALGQGAGSNNVGGSNNTFIGQGANSISPGNFSNATAIGSGATIQASNIMVLGDGSINVGIGTNSPIALLEVAGDGGILIPRGSTDPPGTDGMLYYNNTNNKFKAYESGIWKEINLDPGWGLNGNAPSAGEYLGTSVASDLIIKTNNVEAIRVSTSQKVGIGTPAPSALLDIKSVANADIELDCGSLQKSEIIFTEIGTFTGSIGYSNASSEEYVYIYEGGNALIAKNGMVSIGGNDTPTSDLNVQGSVSNTLTTFSSNITLDSNYHTLVYTGGGGAAVTLPSAASCPGREYRISKITGSSSLSINSYSGQNIDGNPNYGLSGSPNKGVVIISNGIDSWYIVNKF